MKKMGKKPSELPTTILRAVLQLQSGGHFQIIVLGSFQKHPAKLCALQKTQVSGVEEFSTVLFAKELMCAFPVYFPKKTSKNKLFEDSCRIFKTLKIYSIGPWICMMYNV